MTAAQRLSSLRIPESQMHCKMTPEEPKAPELSSGHQTWAAASLFAEIKYRQKQLNR
jgi:hypothetical protein